jgi:hypothetical protein
MFKIWISATTLSHPSGHLGVQWDLKSDSLTFSVALPERPYTRRGLLSTINSVYDPLGVACVAGGFKGWEITSSKVAY